MRRYRIAAGALLLVLTFAAAGVWFDPVPGNFLDYLSWRLTSGVTPEKGKIHYNGAHIHYVAYGKGKPVLLLHGGLSNRLCWFSQIPWLVEAGRQVILIDTRGHGESTLGRVKLSYPLFAQDVIKVLDRLGIRQTDMVGWSDGGIIALLLGRNWPDRVGKIIAISANFNPSGIKPEVNAALRATDSGQLSQVRLWLQGWWSGAGKNITELKTRIRRLWRTSPRLGREDLQTIRAPVLVIVGEKDLITLNHSAQLAHWLGNGRMVVIPGAGHSAPVTHADVVDALIEAFLRIE